MKKFDDIVSTSNQTRPDKTWRVVITRERMSFFNPAEFVPTQQTGCLTDPGLAKDIVRCFTFADGIRALDCSRTFRQIRKVFGANCGFVFGFPADDDFKFGLAEALGNKIRSFVLNGQCPGIEVFDRADGGEVLVVATGERSQRFNVPVFVRLDVHTLEDGPYLGLDRILFTDRDGNSFAGIADIPDRIWYNDVRHADKAFRETLGTDFDVFGVNAHLYRGWDEANSKGASEFSVNLSEFQRKLGSGTTGCRFLQRDGAWQITLIVDGKETALGTIVGDCPEFVVDPKAAELAVAATRDAIVRLSQDDSEVFLDFRHLFDERHLPRFSDGFAALVRENPNAARNRFVQTLRRELSSQNCKAIPFFYHAGLEKRLLVGAEIDSEIALMIPLSLTDEDCEHGIPSTYLVACVKEDADGHRECAFPTILSGRQAEMNYRYFRRAVRNGRLSAA